MAPMLNTPHSEFQADQKRFVVPQTTIQTNEQRLAVYRSKMIGVSLLKGETLETRKGEWWHQFSGTVWANPDREFTVVFRDYSTSAPLPRRSVPVSEARLAARAIRIARAARHHKNVENRTEQKVCDYLWALVERPRRVRKVSFEAQMAGLSDFFRMGVKHDVNVSFDFSEFERLARSAMSACESALIIATGGDGRMGQLVRQCIKGIVPLAVVGAIVYTAGVGVDLVVAMFRRLGYTVCDLLPTGAQYAPQFGEKGECATFGKMALACLTAWMVGQKSAVSAAVTMVSRFAPFIAGATTVAEVFMEFSQWLVNKLMHLAGGEPIEFFRRRAKQVTDWIKAVMKEISTTDQEIGKAERVIQLYKDGMVLKAEFINTPAYADIERAFRELDKVYNSYAAALAQMKASRPEPLCLVLQGTPGIGKSAMLAMLHGFVMAYLHPEEVQKALDQGIDVSAMMFQKDPGPYFDGYDPVRHKTFAIDDGGTAIPVAGVPDNDYMTIMRVINTAACPLEMAELSGKGTTYFRSELVLVTTNLTTAQWTKYAEMVVTTPGAVIRRLRMFATVTVKPDRTGPGGLKIRPECCELPDSWDITIAEEGNAPVTFSHLRDLAQYISGEMTRRNAIHRGLQKAVNAGIREIMDDKLEPQFGLVDWWTGTSAEERAQHNDMLAAVKRFKQFQSWKSEREYSRMWWPNVSGLGNLSSEALTCSDYIGAACRDVKRIAGFGVECAISASTESYFRATNMFGETIRGWWKRNGLLLEMVLSSMVISMAIPILFSFLFRIVSWLGLIKTPKPKKKSKRVEVEPQFANAEEADDEIARKLARNSYNMSLVIDGETVLSKGGRILFVQGRLAVLPQHYFRYFASYIARYQSKIDTAFLKFTNALGDSFLEPLSRFSSVGAVGGFCKSDDNGIMEDAVMVKFNTHEHTSLSGRFLSLTDTHKDHESFYWTEFSEGGVDLNVVRGRFDGPVQYRDTKMSTSNVVRLSLKYTVPCDKGDCGNVLLSREASCGSRRIIGLHVAGDTGSKQGLAVVLTDEWIANAMAKCSEVNVTNRSDITEESVEPAEYQPQVYGEDPMGEFITHRLLIKSGYSPALEGPSLVPGTVHGWAPCEKQPARTDYASTKLAMLAYGGRHVLDSGDEDIYEAAATQTLNDTGCPAHLNNRMLSVLEAMKGQNVWGRFAEPINTKTSPGFPWRNKGIPKSKLFDKHTGEVKVESQAFVMLCDNVLTLLDKARRGEDLLVIFQISPKPELRKPGKPPRIIQGAPLHYVVAWRILFWSLMMHYARWSPEKEAAIGLNPFAHWETLVRFICPNRHLACVGAGDYKNFDQSHEPLISRAIGEAVIARYPDDGWATARRQMWRCLCAPHITFGGVVYKLDRGLPSGHPATALVNSLYNSTLFRLCYASQKTRTPGKTFGGDPMRAVSVLSQFARKVRLAVLGDDNLFGSDDADFNELVLPELMRQFGATYTLDVKDAGPAVQPFRLITDVTFVGRAFNYSSIELAFLPSLRIESIWQQGQYALKENQICDEWHKATYRSVMGELSYHPQDIWNEWAPRALEAWSARGIKLPGPLVVPSPTSRAYWRGDFESDIADWN